MPGHTPALQEVALRYFMEVVRGGSVTAAAERLDVAPSAVSRQIARLEKSLDTLLFERRARGMVPNAAGELLAAYARHQQQDTERIVNEISALRGLRQGRIHLVTTAGFALDFLPGVIAAFRRRYAGIRFELDICTAAEVPRRIREGEGDIGMSLGAQPEPGVHVELRYLSSVLAVVGPAHPLARRRRLSVSEIAAYPLALPARDTMLRHLFDICCSRQNLQCVPVFTCADLNPLIAFAAEEGGVTLCGELAARARIKAGAIRAIPLRDREMNERYIEVQTLAGRVLPSACQEFLRDLRQAIFGEAAQEAAGA